MAVLYMTLGQTQYKTVYLHCCIHGYCENTNSVPNSVTMIVTYNNHSWN
jgi:hypothetical protein